MLKKLLVCLLATMMPLFVMAEEEVEEVTPEQVQQLAQKPVQQPLIQKSIIQKPVFNTQQNLAEFYEWVNALGDPGNPITMEDMQDYFAPTAFLLTNGKIVAKNYKEFFEYFESLRGSYKSMQVLLPFQDVVVSGNKAAVRYVINATTHDDQQFKFYVIAILKFADNRVSEYSEVVYKEPVKINPPK